MQGGALGTWREETPLPDMRSYISQSVEVVHDRIYIIGGGLAATTNTLENQLGRANDVLWTRVNSDGTLEPWKRSQPFTNDPCACTATSSNDRHLFVLGGSANSGITDRTSVCDLDKDGAPVNWRPALPLPTPLWFHGAAVLEDRIYVWGGLTQRANTSINSKVYCAAVMEDGSLGAWREETPMPAATYSSAFCGFNGYLVGVGGRYKGGIYTNAIWYARLQDGRVGQWTVLNTDLEARLYHALGLDKLHGYVYVMGGQFKDANTRGFGRMLSAVQAFQITQPPQQRLEVARSARPASAATSAASPASAAAAQGSLLDLRSALTSAKQSGRKALVLFYSPEVPACKHLWDSVVQTSAFSSATAGYVVAAYDTTKESDDALRRYSIYKVPSAAVLDGDGNLLNSTLRLKTLDDVKALIAQ